MKQQLYDAIYLSPHLDDVALSCGGQIFERTQAGERILIVTVTAGHAPTTLSPFAQMQHQSMQLDANPVAQRRSEDREACRILGADYHHWPILDCIYRSDPLTGRPLYQSDGAIFGAVDPIEHNLLTAHLAQLPAHKQLIAPLGIGNHVDHQLTVTAAQSTCTHFYPDYPYTQRTGYQPPTTAVLIPLSDAAVHARIAAIAAYTSQVPHLFGSPDAMKAAVHADIATFGGELLLSTGV